MTAGLFPLEQIDPNPWQPRQGEDPEHLESLAQSILADGLLQTPAARQVDGRFQLLFGHSRFHAVQLLRERGEHGSAERHPGWEDFQLMPLEIVTATDEGMFRQAIAENLQRRDLNPIEEAQAMRRAMQDFKYTSAQVGELFGKSDATVRGKVRLLDLPADAQAGLASGSISEGAARSILSVQKIMPADVLAATVKEIQAKGDELQPEEIISGKLRNKVSWTVDMWRDDVERGKPRAGWHLWPLDMKNFPNKLLPEEMPAGLTLTDEQREHLINPPACTACPYYTRIRGTHWCGFSPCHHRKKIAWKTDRTQALGRELGIALYSPEDGEYRLLDNYAEAHSKLYTDRSLDLRLIAKDAVKGSHYQGEWAFKGLDNELAFVMAVGEELKAMKAEKKKARQAQLEESEWNARHGREKTLRWEAAQHFAALFEALPERLLRAMVNNVPEWKSALPKEAKPPKEDQENYQEIYPAFLRRKLAYSMFTGMDEIDEAETLSEMVGVLELLAAECHLPPLAFLLAMAAEMDADLAARFPDEEAASAGSAQVVAVETEVDEEVES